MTKKNDKQKEKMLQWHSAFYAGLQIELEEDADKLTFENEHALGTKPMLIDVLIIKKNAEDRIHKNIGWIFRKYNIVEYKSPTDYLSIDDFYKVYGYTCFYKSLAKTENEIKVGEVTITFVCNSYPAKFIKHLSVVRKLEIKQVDQGIYYLLGDIFPMQLIVSSKLSHPNNIWLKNLTYNIDNNKTINSLIEEYSKHEHEKLYKSVMNIIVRANNEKFKEVRGMCEALRELFEEEFEEREKAAMQKGLSQGIHSMIRACKSLGATREQVCSMVVENFETTDAKAEEYMEMYW